MNGASAAVQDPCEVCQVTRFDLIKHFTNLRHCNRSRKNLAKWTSADARKSILVFANFELLGCDGCWKPDEKQAAREFLRKVDRNRDGTGRSILADFVVWPNKARVGIVKFKPGQREVFLARNESWGMRRGKPGRVTLDKGRSVVFRKLENVAEAEFFAHLGIPSPFLACTGVEEENGDDSDDDSSDDNGKLRGYWVRRHDAFNHIN